MANDSARGFGNAIVGTPAVGGDTNVYEIHATPRFKVGTGFTRSDGALFRYGYSSGGVAVGKLVAPTFASAGLAMTTSGVIATASATATPREPNIQPGAVGSHFVQITKGSVTANFYAGGHLVVEGLSGAGYVYRIKGNTATGTPTSTDFYLELYEPIVVALGSNSSILIVPNLWNDVALCDTTNAAPCGVAMNTTTTAKPYGWFCVRGQVSLLQDQAWTAGAPITASRSVAGAAAPLGYATTNPVQMGGALGGAIIGYAVSNGADQKYGAAHLCLE